jgi:hypothetical protein
MDDGMQSNRAKGEGSVSTLEPYSGRGSEASDPVRFGAYDVVLVINPRNACRRTGATSAKVVPA